MTHPVDYERIEHLVSESASQMKHLLREAYRAGFLDGAEYQRRELVNLYQRSVAEYTNQVEQHQAQLTNAVNGVARRQQQPPAPHPVPVQAQTATG